MWTNLGHAFMDSKSQKFEQVCDSTSAINFYFVQVVCLFVCDVGDFAGH